MRNKNRAAALLLTGCLVLSLTGCEDAGEGYAYQNDSVEYIREKAGEQGNYHGSGYEDGYTDAYDEEYGVPDADEYDYGDEYGDSSEGGLEDSEETEIPGQEYFGFEEDPELEEKVFLAWSYLLDEVSSEKEASGQEQGEVSDDTVLWMNATYAVWTKTFDGDMHLIGGMEEGGDSETIWKAVLERDWDITEKADVTDQLLWLLEEGHRAYFRQGVSGMQENGLLELTEEELLEGAEYLTQEQKTSLYMSLAAGRAYRAEGMHGIDAWDYVRGMQVTAMAYLAGYYSLEETLDTSYLFAQIIQSKWDSWDEMYQNYLYGYDFFAADDPQEEGSASYTRRQYAQELKEMEEGPYSLAWDMQLKPGWNTELE